MLVSHQLSRRDKRKSWTISILIHALLLLLCLLPFIVQTVEREDFSHAIVINFEDSATKQSGRASAAASAESSTSEAHTPREQVALAAVSSIQPSSALPVPSRAIPMTEATPDLVLPTTRTNSPKADRFFEQPVEIKEQYEVDRVEMFKAKPNPSLQQKVVWHVADTESAEKGAPTSFDFGDSKGTANGSSNARGTTGKAPDGQSEDAGFDPFGDGTFPDGAGKGDGSKGKDTGVGEEGKGLNWGDFAGDGLFNRKVIKRANVARIAVKEGKVVINLCVDQLGSVVFAQYDLPNSTIRDKAIVAKAEECAKQYVFDEDPSAPREQCGRLTFIFEIK